MAKLTKKQKALQGKVDSTKLYALNEAIGIVKIAELPHHAHAFPFLRFDELAVEQLDQHIALARVQRVLAQLDDLRIVRRRIFIGHDALLVQFGDITVSNTISAI